MDYEREDKKAFDRGIAAIQSGEAPFTLLDACQRAHLDPPVSEDDLHNVWKLLRQYGIHHNLETEPCYLKWLGQFDS